MAGPHTPLMAGGLELAAGLVGPAVRSEARLPPPSGVRSTPIVFDPLPAVRKGRCLIPSPTAAFPGSLLPFCQCRRLARQRLGEMRVRAAEYLRAVSHIRRYCVQNDLPREDRSYGPPYDNTPRWLHMPIVAIQRSQNTRENRTGAEAGMKARRRGRFVTHTRQ